MYLWDNTAIRQANGSRQFVSLISGLPEGLRVNTSWWLHSWRALSATDFGSQRILPSFNGESTIIIYFCVLAWFLIRQREDLRLLCVKNINGMRNKKKNSFKVTKFAFSSLNHTEVIKMLSVVVTKDTKWNSLWVHLLKPLTVLMAHGSDNILVFWYFHEDKKIYNFDVWKCF